MKAPNILAAIAFTTCAVLLATGLVFAIDPSSALAENDAARAAQSSRSFQNPQTSQSTQAAPGEAAASGDASQNPQAASGETIIPDNVPQATSNGAAQTAPGDTFRSLQAASDDASQAAPTSETTARETPPKDHTTNADEASDAAAGEESSGTASRGDERDAAKPHAVGPRATEPRTIDVDGVTMAYIDSFKTESAPASGAGIWAGSDSTTDGGWGYFIGHNPGSFAPVMDLSIGDAVTICDSAGQTRTYRVIDLFTVPDTAYWEDIEPRVTGHGESIALQTCCGDHANYRVVVAV